MTRITQQDDRVPDRSYLPVNFDVDIIRQAAELESSAAGHGQIAGRPTMKIEEGEVKSCEGWEKLPPARIQDLKSIVQAAEEDEENSALRATGKKIS
jgi:hypothetical protein